MIISEALIESLLDILDDIVNILNTDRHSDKVGGHTALNKLFVRKLTVGGGSGMQDAGSQ